MSRLALFATVILGALSAPVADGSVAAASTTSSATYYVSLGDSYAVGAQPGLGATPGYAGYVAAHTRLTLRNFGCPGATTASVLLTVGCPASLPHTEGGVPYPSRTQVAAAVAFIAAHRGHIGLITVSIGANDVDGCGTASDPIACVRSVMPEMQANVTTLAAILRAAAGPGVPLIGSTYPDLVLGAFVHPTSTASASWVYLALVGATAFRLYVNPSLTASYSSAGGSLVDVTKATGAYTPLTQTVQSAKYGTLPVAVASACALAWYCDDADIHMKTSGYDLIGKLIAAKYRALKRTGRQR